MDACTFDISFKGNITNHQKGKGQKVITVFGCPLANEEYEIVGSASEKTWAASSTVQVSNISKRQTQRWEIQAKTKSTKTRLGLGKWDPQILTIL